MPIDYKLAQENYERYVYARDNGHMDFVRKADECERFYQGLQWDEAIRQKLLRQGKPALTINKILSTITAVQGELINNRAEITFKPAKGGTDETAHALSRTYLQVGQKNRLVWTEQDVADDGFILSRGFYDCRVAFDDNLLGHIDLRLLDPRNVVIDPDANSYDPDGWKELFITSWMAPQDIALHYSEADAEILKHRQMSDFMFGYDSIERVPQNFGNLATIRGQYPNNQDQEIRRKVRVIERQYWKQRRVFAFVDRETYDTRTVPENWSEERVREVAHLYNLAVIRRNHKQIRWTVTADTVKLHDDWSPLKHFTVVPYFPYFRRGKTLGLVEPLLGSQEQLNKTSSQELHIVNTTANSGWKVKAGSLVNMTSEQLEERGSETGLVIEYEGDNDKVVSKIEPNQVPTGIDRISTKADAWIKELSGVSDSMRGFDRSDVAARAIEAKQQRGQTNLVKPFENLRRTRHLLAERIRDLVQTYYTEPRVLRITGERPTDEAEDIPINTFDEEAGRIVNDLTVGEYDIVITTRPPRETYDEDQYQEAVRMRQDLGIPIPDKVVIELSHLENKHEIIRQMGFDSTEEEREARERQAQQESAAAETENRKRIADAELATARAQKVIAEMRGEIPNEEQRAAEATKAAEVELKRMELEHKAEMERERLEFERWKFEEEQDAEIAYKERELEIRERQVEAQAAQARAQQRRPQTSS